MSELRREEHIVAPASAGISWKIKVFLVVSLIIIFWQGSNVVRASIYGRPGVGGDATKVQLPASNT
jgi:hypothetical protein